MVERFFRSLTVDRLRRGVFQSVAELKTAILAYIAAYNAHPKPFLWTAKANDILQKVMRGRAALAGGRSNSVKHYSSSVDEQREVLGKRSPRDRDALDIRHPRTAPTPMEIFWQLSWRP